MHFPHIGMGSFVFQEGTEEVMYEVVYSSRWDIRP